MLYTHHLHQCLDRNSYLNLRIAFAVTTDLTGFSSFSLDVHISILNGLEVDTYMIAGMVFINNGKYGFSRIELIHSTFSKHL